jgi:hypothetical protein
MWERADIIQGAKAPSHIVLPRQGECSYGHWIQGVALG